MTLRDGRTRVKRNEPGGIVPAGRATLLGVSVAYSLLATWNGRDDLGRRLG